MSLEKKHVSGAGSAAAGRATATFQQKAAAHQVLDLLWMAFPGNEEDKQQFRTLLYKFWGAVLAGELSDVTGVRKPRNRDGGQHISTMRPDHCAKMHDFIAHLVRDNKGNLALIATKLELWSGEFDARDSKIPEEIHDWLNRN